MDGSLNSLKIKKTCNWRDSDKCGEWDTVTAPWGCIKMSTISFPLTLSPSLCRRTKSLIWKSAKALKWHLAAGYQIKKHLASQRAQLKSVWGDAFSCPSAKTKIWRYMTQCEIVHHQRFCQSAHTKVAMPLNLWVYEAIYGNAAYQWAAIRSLY